MRGRVSVTLCLQTSDQKRTASTRSPQRLSISGYYSAYFTSTRHRLTFSYNNSPWKKIVRLEVEEKKTARKIYIFIG